MNTIKTTVLDYVKKDTVMMIPRWKFILYSCFGVLGMVFIFLLTVFIVSLIIFLMTRYGLTYMPFMDMVKALRAVTMLPIVLFVCAVLLLFVIEVLSRKYSFSFRRPLIVTLFIVTSTAVLVGFAVSESGAHEYMKMYAREHRIAPMLRMYDRPVRFGPPHQISVIRGEVISLSATSATVLLFDEKVITVAYPRSSQSTSSFVVGGDVLVFGVLENNLFIMKSMRHAPEPSFHKRAPMNTMMHDERIDKRHATTTKNIFVK